jgi:hypothetical protein
MKTAILTAAVLIVKALRPGFVFSGDEFVLFEAWFYLVCSMCLITDIMHFWRWILEWGEEEGKKRARKEAR